MEEDLEESSEQETSDIEQNEELYVGQLPVECKEEVYKSSPAFCTISLISSQLIKVNSNRYRYP